MLRVRKRIFLRITDADQWLGVSTGLTTTVAGAGSASALPWMASYTSWRWTGTSLGATMPSRTLSPRISTTVTVMSLLMTMLSFFFLDSTNIAAYPSLRQGAIPAESGSHALTLFAAPDQQNAPVKIPFPCRNQA